MRPEWFDRYYRNAPICVEGDGYFIVSSVDNLHLVDYPGKPVGKYSNLSSEFKERMERWDKEEAQFKERLRAK